MQKKRQLHMTLIAGLIMNVSIRAMEDPNEGEQVPQHIELVQEKNIKKLNKGVCFELLFKATTPGVQLCMQATQFNDWGTDDGWRYLIHNQIFVSKEPVEQLAYYLIPDVAQDKNAEDVRADSKKIAQNMQDAHFCIIDNNEVNHPRSWIKSKNNRKILPQLFVQVTEKNEELTLQQQDLVLGGFGKFMRATLPFTKGLADHSATGSSIVGSIDLNKVLKLKHIFFNQTEKNREKRKTRIMENLALLLDRARDINSQCPQNIEVNADVFRTVCDTLKQYLPESDMGYKYITSNEFDRALTEISLQPNKTLEQINTDE